MNRSKFLEPKPAPEPLPEPQQTMLENVNKDIPRPPKNYMSGVINTSQIANGRVPDAQVFHDGVGPNRMLRYNGGDYYISRVDQTITYDGREEVTIVAVRGNGLFGPMAPIPRGGIF